MSPPRVENRDATERRRAHLALWCRAGLEVSAGVGYASFLLAEAHLDRREGGARELLRWLCVAAIVLLPLLTASFRRATRSWSTERRRWVAEIALYALPLALLLPGDPAHFGLCILALAQGVLLGRGSRDAMAAWSLALGPLSVACGMTLSPAPEWLFLFPLSIVIALAGASLLRGRALERELEERAPRVLANSGATRELPAAREGSRRVLGSLGPSLALLGSIPIAYLATSALRAAVVGTPPRPESPEPSSRTRDARRAAGGALPYGSERAATRFPSRLAYGGEVAPLSDGVVMEIVPSRVGGVPLESPPRALYMRGLVLDRFDARGAASASSAPLRPMRARQDGWVVFDEHPAAQVLELEVHLEPLLLGDDWSPVLFAPEPLYAIDRAQILSGEDGRVLLPRPALETLGYRLRTALPGSPGAPRARGRAAHADPLYVELPPACDELERIAERARGATDGARDDAERVRLLLDHFRRDYAYSLDEPGLPGLAGVLDFLERRVGRCTDFAVAAALMLRTLGIPSRVATGYLASDWSAEERRFRVTGRNGHAWIEVCFEGEGWVSLDPTPPNRRAAALAAAAADPERGVASWLAELRDEARFWASTGGHEAYLRSFARTLADGPRALVTSLERQPGWLALLALALVLAWARSRAGRGDRTSGAGEGKEAASDALRRLLEALARAGFPRAKGQTLREVSTRAASSGAPELAALPRIARALQRERYGAPPLDATERAGLDELVRALGEAARSGR